MFLSRIKSDKGFSLIEVIVGTVIIAIVFVIMLRVQSQLHLNSIKAEIVTRGTSIARNYMELVRSKRFDENVEPPWSTSLASEEAYESDFDDVDDYADFSESTIDGFPGYGVKIKVFYVDPTVSWDDKLVGLTNFKRIVVTITHGELDSLSLSSLASSRYDIE